MKCPERQAEDLTEERQAPCSHSVRYFRYAQYVGLPAEAKEPPKRLVGWEKIRLAPGEARTVTVKLEPKFLSIFNEQKDDWELLSGEYKFFVGGSFAQYRAHGIGQALMGYP